MARELVLKGEAEAKVGRWESSSRLLREAIDLLEEEGEDDEGLLPRALRQLAYSECRQGNFKDGVALARRAMEISAKAGDKFGEADALGRLGYIHWRKGDFDLAVEFYDSALDRIGEDEAPGLYGRTITDKASALSSLGRKVDAIVALTKGADILREAGDLNELARAYNNLGSVLMDSRRYEEAIESFRLCIRTANEAGDELRKGWAAMNTGACLTKMGRGKEAKAMLKKAMDHLVGLNDRIGIAYTYLEYAWAHLATEDVDDAEKAIRKALGLLRDLSLLPDEAEACLALGRICISKGRVDEAVESLERARELYDQLNMKEGLAEVEMLLNELSQEEGVR